MSVWAWVAVGVVVYVALCVFVLALASAASEVDDAIEREARERAAGSGGVL